MKNVVLLLTVILISANVYSQKWTYKAGGSDFDGKYRTCSVRGSGGEFPYENPLFVVNRFEGERIPNVYFSNAGYAGCDNKLVYIKFNNEDQIYKMEASTNENSDVWFVGYASWVDEDSRLSVVEMIKKTCRGLNCFCKIVQ